MYYISFDPFSLVNEKFKIFCGKNGEENLKRFVSISIGDEKRIKAEDLYNSSSRPSKNIIEFLKILGEKHGMKFPSYDSDDSNDSDDSDDSDSHKNSQKSNFPVHFLLDEVPQEIFGSNYSEELGKGLKNYFEHSTVVIALQSVRKVREIQSSDKPQKPGKKLDQMDMEPLTKHEVKLFELKTCVRMSSQLHELQKNLEAEAEKAPFHANLTYKEQKGITWII